VLSSAILGDPSRDVHDLLTSDELGLWSFLDEPSMDGGPSVSYTLRPPSSSSSSSPATLDEILRRLRAFEDVVYVNVRLVGFDGEGEQRVEIAEACTLSLSLCVCVCACVCVSVRAHG
jgi:hypothetical protein